MLFIYTIVIAKKNSFIFEYDKWHLVWLLQRESWIFCPCMGRCDCGPVWDLRFIWELIWFKDTAEKVLLLQMHYASVREIFVPDYCLEAVESCQGVAMAFWVVAIQLLRLKGPSDKSPSSSPSGSGLSVCGICEMSVAQTVHITCQSLIL